MRISDARYSNDVSNTTSVMKERRRVASRQSASESYRDGPMPWEPVGYRPSPINLGRLQQAVITTALTSRPIKTPVTCAIVRHPGEAVPWYFPLASLLLFLLNAKKEIE